MNLRRIWTLLHSRDLYTWLGHGVLGFVLGFLFGPVFVAGAFVYREASDLLGWWADPRRAWHGPLPYPTVSAEFKRSFSEQMKDSFFDLWAPLAGAALAEILKGLL